MKIFVETSWLNENLYKSNIKIIDSSWYLPNEKRNCYNEYLKEHIPGSLFIDIDNISDAVLRCVLNENDKIKSKSFQSLQ